MRLNAYSNNEPCDTVRHYAKQHDAVPQKAKSHDTNLSDFLANGSI